VPPFRLRVLRILDLEPAVFRVHAHPALGDHTFKIPLDHFLEQEFAIALNMLRVQNLNTRSAQSAFVSRLNGTS
jgi:hypothetical protein